MNDRRNLKVLHIITAFNLGGGAETLLVRLLEMLDEEQRSSHRIISLGEPGTLAPHAESLGVPVEGIGMSGDPSPAALGPVRRLGQMIRRSGADVVQTWMLHSNVLAGITAQVASRIPVVWGVHVSRVGRHSFGVKAVLTQRVEAISSWGVPARIIACSSSSRRAMEELHYRTERIVTIHNGIDVNRFKPDPEERSSVRRELGIDDHALVLANIARFHPIKDHASLLQAVRGVLNEQPNSRLVLCGPGLSPSNPELARLAEPLGDQVLMLSQRSDLPRLLTAFDVVVSSSLGEALSLAVGEAMAAGVPVVATDAGDSAELVGDTGIIVPPGAPEALERGLAQMAAEGHDARVERGRQARARITDSYSLATMTEGYEEVWREVTDGRREG
jgi:glycosyltransferase involved in cell wall biosynthesis